LNENWSFGLSINQVIFHQMTISKRVDYFANSHNTKLWDPPSHKSQNGSSLWGVRWWRGDFFAQKKGGGVSIAGSSSLSTSTSAVYFRQGSSRNGEKQISHPGKKHIMTDVIKKNLKCLHYVTKSLWKKLCKKIFRMKWKHFHDWHYHS
jgi:hypothetical protein